MKKAMIDFPILTLIVLIVMLLVLAPTFMKIFSTTQTQFSDALGSVGESNETAQANFNSVMNTATNFWDAVIIAAFIIGVLLMLLSAFFIDTHPVWIVLYIFIMFMLILFAPDMMEAIDTIYESATFSTEVASLPFTDFVRSNFSEILVGFFMLTGIIIYGKIRLFSSNIGGGRK